jgi:hypothetical protein
MICWLLRDYRGRLVTYLFLIPTEENMSENEIFFEMVIL